MKLALIALGLLATSGVEAIEMYARFLKARHRVAAAAREKAEALKLRGDIEGHVVWSRVAELWNTAFQASLWEVSHRRRECALY